MTRVLTIGADVPRTLVLAAGAVPVRLDGLTAVDEAAMTEAADLVGSVAAVFVGVLAEVLTEADAGSLDDVAAIVVSNDAEGALRTFYVLRMLAETGRLRMPVHLLDLQRLPGPAVTAFDRGRLEAFRQFLQKATDVLIDDAAVVRAAAQERAVHAARASLRAARRAVPAEVSGADTARVAALVRRAEPVSAVAAVAALVRQTRPGSRIVLTGSDIADPAVIAAIEQRGATVVADDHSFGDGEAIGVAADSVSALYDAVLADLADRPQAAALGAIADRAAQTAQLAAQTQADLVLCLIGAGDEAPLWDVAAQRAAVEALGIRFAGPFDADPQTLSIRKELS